jgi:hypothetical protein
MLHDFHRPVLAHYLLKVASMKSVWRFLFWLICPLVLASTVHGQVIISEFLADNKNTLADENGEFTDWIELYNTGTATVNLGGWSLTDDPTRQVRWFFPATNLTAKGFMVVFASGKDRAVAGAPLHTDFALKASGEYLALLRPDGTVTTEFAPMFPEQFPDISYGLGQEVTTNTLLTAGAAAKVLIPAAGTLGSTWIQPGFNDTGWTSGTTGVGYETAVPGFAVYNFKANVAVGSLAAAEGVISNPSQQSAVYSENAPVINYFNTGGSGEYGNDRTFPGFTIGGDVEDYVVEATATLTIPVAGNWTFGVSSDDGFGLSIGNFSMSFPDPRGPGDTLATFNFSGADDYPLRLVFYERGGGSEVELFAAQGTYAAWDPTNFRLVGDAANGGLNVRAPVVGGGGGATSYRPFITTDLQAQMSGVNATAYLRIPFSVANPATVQSLTLRMMYDDGFVAYLNGQEIARRNAPATPQWNSAATASHPNYQALVFEDINTTDHLNALLTGSNLLAIQGLNQGSSDTDFLIRPELVEYKIAALTNHYFAAPTPGAPNGSGFFAFVTDTKFDHDRGFYSSPFSLSITTAMTNATIRYTTDGSTPSLSNGTTYSGPIAIGATTVIRAAAFKDGFEPSDVDTQTYVFLSDVIRQSPTGAPPPGWPGSWGGNVVDYGMDPDVVNNPAYSGTIVNDLKTIPSYSLVTDLGNLFDPATGIYANPGQDGITWERPASIELIYPDGTKGFQVDAGLRIRGGFSRSTDNPKHAFRFFFRQEYGTSKLKFPVFASQNGTDTFDGFDLRTFQNYSWSFQGDYRGIFLRDQFSRDTQFAQGQPTERGDFYHLYINGQYWGLYNTAERPEAAYGESYFGGRKEDYDVIKVNTEAGYTVFATDGDMNAWTRLWMAATNGFANDADYFRIQGLNVDGTPNPAYENLLDVDNLIDYMLVIFFAGNLDAPISEFISDANPNNMFAVRNRTGLYGGFRFFAHDSEHTLLHESPFGSDEIHRDRTGPFAAGDPTIQGATDALARSNPQYLFTRLIGNAEFRLRVADHAQKQFFNGGALTTEACRARFLVRSNEINRAVVGESARWGDAKRGTPFTRDAEWVTEMNRVYGDYFGQRPGIVLGQLQAKGLFPTVVAPSFNQFGGNVPSGFQLTMTAPNRTIYYTRDGSDPRLRGGGISPTALPYSGPLSLTQSAQIKARCWDGFAWSGLSEATFYVIQNFTGLLITEIMYHPPGTTNLDGDAFEFVELKNVTGANLELSGVRFTNGISYTFPVGKFVAPGQFIVLVSNPTAFATKYPGVRVDGVYTNNLSNSGEMVTLVHVTGAPIFSASYDTRPPWPASADGTGFSLVSANPNLNPDPNNSVNWRASTAIGGSPGADDAPSNVPRVLINEALTHTDPPQLDTIELYNPNSTNVDISNWYLTDQRTSPQKFRISANDTRAHIPPGGYVVFTENDWNAVPTSTNSFRLDSHGEEVYLYSAEANGNLTGYSDGFSFGAAQNGVTFGRYVISTGEAQYPAQLANTLPGTNAGPRIGPVVINEIRYHPALGDEEFVELKKTTNGPVKLYDPDHPTNTWRINGIGFDFPMNIEMTNDLMLVVGSDPAAFRAKYGVPTDVAIFGPFPGALQDGGETLSLQRPDAPDLDTNTGSIFLPHIDVDVVRYDNKSPWPTNADGFGPSLERINASAYGDDPINWRASPGGASPGLENTGNRRPLVNAGPDQSWTGGVFPFAAALNGSAADDGQPSPPGAVTATWSQVSGPGAVWFDNLHQPNTTAHFPGTGTYVLRLSADDGALQASDDVVITLERSPSAVAFVPKGSVWKYLDNGSDQGTAWIAAAFNDSTWASGPAQLGYSSNPPENDEATIVNFGPDPNNKYTTTYFRHTFMVSSAASVTNLTVRVLRDDGAVVYLNGAEIFRSNMPGGAVNYRTFALTAVGGADETSNFYTTNVNPARLSNGTNVLAVEIHQANTNSTDISFDLELAGSAFPPNQGPSANAGADQTITLPASASLAGTVNDDGLPIPPGLLTIGWSKVSGPGTVTFASPNSPVTQASFSAAGNYVLRLTAADGATSVIDDVAVTVEAGVQPPLRIESVAWASGTSSILHLYFTAVAGQTYTVQCRDSLSIGSWQKLSDVPGQPVTQTVQVSDATVAGSATRYYRIVTPRQ